MKRWELKPMYLRYKGVFDMDQLYDFIFKWMQDRKLRTHENRYKHRPDSPWGYKHKLRIQGTRKVDGFYSYVIDVEFEARDTAEIEIDGKHLYSGRFQMKFSGAVITDYSKKFEANAFTKILEKILYKMIQREIELVHWDVLHYQVHDFQEEIKGMLNMHTPENYFKV